MEKPDHRTLTTQLASDLGWLEDHCRKSPQLAAHSSELHLAAALVRNVIGPFLDGQPAIPLHIAVVGGAGTGKSTVSNMLTGAPSAEANPQAGFTRHPIAYVAPNTAATWTGHVGFLGKLQRLANPGPSSLDADVYQIRTVTHEPKIVSLLQRFVIWDCPDMTTWAASGYVPRLLEAAALADVIVYVASDERYNDEIPTQFLHMLLRAGKPVVCCLTKMREADAPAFLAHFQKEVLSKMPGGAVCVAIPNLKPEQLADPARLADKYRIPLVNQINVLGDPPQKARIRTVRAAANYLATSQEKLLSVAKRDIDALESWRSLVKAGQQEFDDRYRREYLASEKYQHFDEALMRLIDMLELPGVGRPVANALNIVRAPYRWLKGFVSKTMKQPEAHAMPEQAVLEGALASWLDMLQKEATQRANSHPLWAHIEKGFAGGLANQARERFQQGVKTFQTSIAEEVNRTARAIYEDLEKNPVALNTLRGSKFTLDVAAILGTVVAGGINWTDLILVPLAASVTQQLVEVLGARYVDHQREQTRLRQQTLVSQHLSGPLATWLAQWPATGGSSFERLQLAIKRIPSAVQHLQTAITQATAGKA
ncbi:MAG: hypothetical protein KatS3mg105_3580 [Gemmatales bacterium]|nr:MAG: hypothetical protein KatS3mg105_3580 [Gemmatales bacterium]